MASKLIGKIVLLLEVWLFIVVSPSYGLVLTSPQNGATFKEGDTVHLVETLGTLVPTVHNFTRT
jgi:hypothetical protein